MFLFVSLLKVPENWWLRLEAKISFIKYFSGSNGRSWLLHLLIQRLCKWVLSERYVWRRNIQHGPRPIVWCRLNIKIGKRWHVWYGLKVW